MGKLKSFIIDLEDDEGYADELYCNLYKCPVCHYDFIKEGDHYCSNCGAMILWLGQPNRPLTAWSDGFSKKQKKE